MKIVMEIDDEQLRRVLAPVLSLPTPQSAQAVLVLP